MSKPPPLPQEPPSRPSGLIQSERILKAVLKAIGVGFVVVIIGSLVAAQQTRVFQNHLIIECPRTAEEDDLIPSRFTIAQIVEQESLDTRWETSREDAIKKTFEILNFEILKPGKCRVTAQSEAPRDPGHILTAWKERSLNPKSEMLLKQSHNVERFEKLRRILNKHHMKGNQLNDGTLSDEEHEKLRLQYISDKDEILALKREITEDGINLDSYQTILEDYSDHPPEPKVSELVRITQLAGILAFIPALIYFLRRSLSPLDDDEGGEAA